MLSTGLAGLTMMAMPSMAMVVPVRPDSVSYTHLDVYKRQQYGIMGDRGDKCVPLAQELPDARGYLPQKGSVD